MIKQTHTVVDIAIVCSDFDKSLEFYRDHVPPLRVSRRRRHHGRDRCNRYRAMGHQGQGSRATRPFAASVLSCN